MRHIRKPQLEDFEGDWDAYGDACEAYEDYLSEMEDEAMERYYNEKYGL